jgi:hypothetical protein
MYLATENAVFNQSQIFEKVIGLFDTKTTLEKKLGKLEDL